MDSGPDCFVSGSYAKLLRLARFAGIAPLSFVKVKTGWRVSVSSTLSICGYRCITIITLLTFSTLTAELFVDRNKAVRMRTNTRRITWIMDSLLMMIFASISVFKAPKQMQSMIACLNHLKKINSELYIHRWPASTSDDQKNCAVAWWAVVTTAILCCVDHGISLYNAYAKGAEIWICQMYILYYLCYWIMQLQELLFVSITQHVVYSFKAVNNSLRQVLHETGHAGIKLYINMPTNTGPSKRKKFLNNKVKSTAVSKNTISDFKPRLYHEKIHSVAHVYVSTLDVVRVVDRCHGLLVLMMLGSFLLHLVFTLYYFITTLLEEQSGSSTMSIVGVVEQLIWCIYHAANLVMLIEPSHASHAEMETTRELVSQLMHCTYSIYDPVAMELELFSRHLMLNQVSYSPMKVTTLTRSVVVAILGSITTYLVVLVDTSI